MMLNVARGAHALPAPILPAGMTRGGRGPGRREGSRLAADPASRHALGGPE